MKLTKILPFILLLIASTAIANAQVTDPAPSVGISAQPGTLVWNSVTIRVSAIDTWPNPGISHIDFYVNGAKTATHNCGFASQCIYTASRTSGVQKNETYHAIVYDMSQSAQTQSLTVTFRGANRPPNLSALPNISINEDSGNNANLTDLWANVTDDWTNSSNLNYNIIAQSNTTVANCAITNNRYIDCATATQNAYGTSVITVTASDGQLTGTGNFTLTVLPVNDAPVFNATIPAVTFPEDTNYTFNISDYVIDVDNALSALSYLPLSIGNITITYTYNTSTNKTQATLTPAQDWNGAVIVNFTANDGMNTSAPSNNVLITVTNVNDAPQFVINSFHCGNMFKYIPYSCNINATDIDTGDTLAFYDNTTLFDVDLNTGWLNFTPNVTGNYSPRITVCDNSGASNNCTSVILVLRIYPHPLLIFLNTLAIPTSPINYAPNVTYNFSTDIVRSQFVGIPIPPITIDKAWLEFNGINYTAGFNNQSLRYYANITSLPAGNYTYRWHANYTVSGLRFNTTTYSYILNKANPGLMLNMPMNLTYGTIANASCTANTTQATPVLTRNGTIVSNPDNTLLGAGTYTYFCYVNQTQNYTAANETKNLTINPAQVTINLSMQSPITFGTAANVTCNASPSGITPTLTRNGAVLPGLTDNSILNAGNYTYVCSYNSTQNYTGTNATQTLTVNQIQTIINLTLNGTNGNIYIPANSSIIVNATTNVPGATLNWSYDGISIGTIPPAWLLFPTIGSHNITARYPGSQNYAQESVTHWIFVAMPAMKMNFTPASGSTINTSFTLSFLTTYNTSCRWSLADTAYTNMTNAFTTAGQTAHSGTVSGLNLGADTVHVACSGDTSINNTDLNYNVQNIIEQGSTLTNGATANNSILYSTSADNSTLQSVNATGSTLRGSVLTNCVVINSTVKNYQGTNCRIVNSFVDPPSPGSDLTGSTITGNSRVMNSNVTYSTVSNSNITNSNVNNSIINTSEITSSTVLTCNITGSQISGNTVCQNSSVSGSNLYNITLTNAVVNNGVLTNGTLTYNGTNYSAPQNISSIVNLPPNSAFTYTRSNLRVNLNSGGSSDPNPGDTLTYFWDFGDGANSTTASTTTTHTYSSAGTYNVTLTATDNLGASDPTPAVQQVTVTASTGGGGTTRYGGGGGGGGGGSSYYARNWEIDLDTRSTDIKTLSRKDTAVLTVNNKTYTLRMSEISREQVNFTLAQMPYSLVNYEIRKIDLDYDGVSEIRIIILNNYFTRAQMRFDRFEEPLVQAPPLSFLGNISEIGLEEETAAEPKQEEKQESRIQKTIQDEQSNTAANQITGEATNWLDKIPKDSQTIGIGITIGVVIAGLIVYFVASVFFI